MSRFSTGHLAMIVAGLLGLLLTVAVLRRADERQPVAVAALDLAPGAGLTESSVHYERVKMDDPLLRTVLQPNDVKRLRGSVAAYPIKAGELVLIAGLLSVAGGFLYFGELTPVSGNG